jgi:hypothetical protein
MVVLGYKLCLVKRGQCLADERSCVLLILGHLELLFHYYLSLKCKIGWFNISDRDLRLLQLLLLMESEVQLLVMVRLRGLGVLHR